MLLVGVDTGILWLCFMVLIKTIQANKCSVSLLGDVNTTVEDITKQAIAFVYRCYNSPNAATMTEARMKACVTNINRKSTLKIPKFLICSLPCQNGSLSIGHLKKGSSRTSKSISYCI